MQGEIQEQKGKQNTQRLIVSNKAQQWKCNSESATVAVRLELYLTIIYHLQIITDKHNGFVVKSEKKVITNGIYPEGDSRRPRAGNCLDARRRTNRCRRGDWGMRQTAHDTAENKTEKSQVRAAKWARPSEWATCDWMSMSVECVAWLIHFAIGWSHHKKTLFEK